MHTALKLHSLRLQLPRQYTRLIKIKLLFTYRNLRNLQKKQLIYFSGEVTSVLLQLTNFLVTTL